MSLALLLLTGGPARGDAPLPHVTVITDSVGGVLLWDGEANQILSSGFDLDVESIICRKLVEPGCGYSPPPPSALDTVNDLGAKLGETVVIDTGYNDTPSEVAEAVDPLMQALVGFGVTHVIWVTLVERLSEWTVSNAEVVAAAKRWPQLILADWNAVALPHPEWFTDEAHMNSLGARALAAFLHPFLVYACGSACVTPTVWCGLARTVNGFDYVDATGIGCAAARVNTVAIERGNRGFWDCARNVDSTIELTCTNAKGQRIELLERSPVPVTRGRDGAVTLANWSFRLHGPVVEARENALGWISLGRAPWCVPDVPREVLLALPLRSLTPDGGCFARR